MVYASDIHVAVYQVLDEVIGAAAVPQGAAATIHSIIDDLHAASAPRDVITQTENISVALHRLGWAVAKNDPDRACDARKQLRTIAAAWLDQRIRH